MTFCSVQDNVSDKKNVPVELERLGAELFNAVQENGFADVKELVDRGAPLKYRNQHGFTPLERACLLQEYESVCYMMDRDEELFQSLKNYHPLFILAAAKHKPELLDYLLGLGFSIDGKGAQCWAPLLHAAGFGLLDAVESLLKYNADIDAKNEHSQSAVNQAAIWGHKDVVKFLTLRGADISSKDEQDKKSVLDRVTEFEGSACEVRAWREQYLKGIGRALQKASSHAIQPFVDMVIDFM